MNENELEKWMRDAGYTRVGGQWFKNSDPRVARAVVQEQKANRPKRKALHRTKDKGMDAAANQRYSVTVFFRYSDKRRRDMDGALSTVLDCLVAARRQSAGYTADPDASGGS